MSIKPRVKRLVVTIVCVATLLALLIPHVFIGLRSWLLEYAVERGDVSMTSLLLNNGASPNMPDDGFSPLMQALQRRHDDVAYLLIDKGGNVNAVGPFGYTPVLCADLSDTLLVSYLIQHGADVNARNDTGTTALMSAASDLHKDAVHMLLAKGAAPNTQDKDGQTPLMQAITSNQSHDKPEQQSEIIKELLEAGADVGIRDVKGQDAVTLARESGNASTVRLVTERRPKSI